MDVLRDFGFRPSDKPDYGFEDSLIYDFGNFRLYADLGPNRWFRQVVLFSGDLFTTRTMAMIEFEISSQIESPELCAALLAYHLRGYRIQPDHEVRWLTEGRQNEDILPWRREQAAYSARPQCTVGREWLRLALKSLAKRIASLADEAPVLFAFQTGVFYIEVGGEAIVMAAKGEGWPYPVTVLAGKLRNLPKRFMHDTILISVWDSSLLIDGYRYACGWGDTGVSNSKGECNTADLHAPN
jgi:hypothetical protein